MGGGGGVKGREAKGEGAEGVVHGAFELAWFGRQIGGWDGLISTLVI